MRVNWQQSLEGLSLLEIRDLLRALHRDWNSFPVRGIADCLDRRIAKPSRATLDRAQRLLEGLIASDAERVEAIREDAARLFADA